MNLVLELNNWIKKKFSETITTNGNGDTIIRTGASIIDSDGNELDVNSDGSIDVNIAAVSTPTIQNVVVTSSGTEYHITIPQSTKRYEIRCRGIAKMQYSFVTGETNTKFITILPGNIRVETNLSLTTDLDVYIEANKNNTTIEILTWA